MSFDFSSNNISQFKAQGAYKDGSGMGGGGMYMRQEKKRKDQPEEDIFESKDDKKDDEIIFDGLWRGDNPVRADEDSENNEV